jgi:hypothetical protein
MFNLCKITGLAALWLVCVSALPAQIIQGNGSAGATTTKTPYQLFEAGDSYFTLQSYGTTNPGMANASGLFLQTTLARGTNIGVPGTTTPQIVNSIYANYVPSVTSPSIVMWDGGANDGGGDTCNYTLTSTCAFNFMQSVQAGLAYSTIPYQDREWASTASQSGSWAADTTDVPVAAQQVLTGTAMSATSNGATATFSISAAQMGSSTVIGLTQVVCNSNTGTFNLSIDGVNQIDAYSNTTTFSSAPNGGTALEAATCSPLEQFFSAAANTAHTVVLTTLSANKVTPLSVDWIPPATNTNTNRWLGFGSQLGFNGGTSYDAMFYSVANNLLNLGLPVYYASQITLELTAVTAGSGYSSNPTCTLTGGTISNSGQPLTCTAVETGGTVVISLAGPSGSTCPPSSANLWATYSSAPVLTISGGGGSGAGATVIIGGSPGVGNTYDVSASETAGCSAATVAGHPNSYGQLDLFNTLYNRELKSGYIFTSLTQNPAVTGSFAQPITFSNAGNGFGPPAANRAFFCTGPVLTGCGFNLGGGNFIAGMLIGKSDATSSPPWGTSYIQRLGTNTNVPWTVIGQNTSGTPASSFAESDFTDHWATHNSDGVTWQTGPIGGTTSTVASASTIAPTTPFFTLTGTTTINTITLMADLPNGCYDFLYTGAGLTTGTTNILASYTLVTNTQYRACYFGTSWSIK